MNIYISTPITGHEMADVERAIACAKAEIERKGHFAVNPLTVRAVDDSYEAHMGADITALLLCDAVVMLDGWQASRGCQLEYRAARIYDKPIYRSTGEIPETPELWYVLDKIEEAK